MQVILLERVEKLGQIGDVVKVKDGFARNFLLPQKKALRATKANKARFETQRAQLEASNLETRSEAEKISRQGRRPQGRADPPGRRQRPALRLGQRRATSPTRSRPPASPSTGARSCSTGRSRRSACIPCASRCIRRSSSRSPPMSPSRPRKPRPRRRPAASSAGPRSRRLDIDDLLAEATRPPRRRGAQAGEGRGAPRAKKSQGPKSERPRPKAEEPKPRARPGRGASDKPDRMHAARLGGRFASAPALGQGRSLRCTLPQRRRTVQVATADPGRKKG